MEFRPSVAFLDDEEIFLQVFTEYLRSEKCRVRAFKDPSRFLQRFNEHYHDFDGILLDGKMPKGKKDGIQVLRECREINPGITTIFVSQYKGYIEKADEEHVDLIIFKGNGSEHNYRKFAKSIKDLIIEKALKKIAYTSIIQEETKHMLAEVIKSSLNKHKIKKSIISKIETDIMKFKEEKKPCGEIDCANYRAFLDIKSQHLNKYLTLIKGKLVSVDENLQDALLKSKKYDTKDEIFIDKATPEVERVFFRRPKRIGGY